MDAAVGISEHQANPSDLFASVNVNSLRDGHRHSLRQSDTVMFNPYETKGRCFVARGRSIKTELQFAALQTRESKRSVRFHGSVHDRRHNHHPDYPNLRQLGANLSGLRAFDSDKTRKSRRFDSAYLDTVQIAIDDAEAF